MPRPTSVTVIGIVWIVIGSLMTLSAFMALLVSGLLWPAMREAPVPSEAPAAVQMMASLFQWFPLLACGQLLFAPFIVWSAMQFLRQRRWARTSLEVINWLALTYVIVFGVFWLWMWNSMLGAAPRTDQVPVDAFRLVGSVMGLVNTVLFAVPLALMLKYLRGKVIREACSQ